MTTKFALPPFPPLTWDGWYWQGKCGVPWFPVAKKVRLVVRAGCSRSADRTPAKDAPPPSDAQVAAFRFLNDAASPITAGLLTAFRRNIPELAEADWDAVQAFVQFADLLVFHAAADEVAYTGFVFNSMEYEHGIGVVAHRDRVAHIGFAETADEAAAEKDSRRQARAKRKKRS